MYVLMWFVWHYCCAYFFM